MPGRSGSGSSASTPARTRPVPWSAIKNTASGASTWPAMRSRFSVAGVPSTRCWRGDRCRMAHSRVHLHATMSTVHERCVALVLLLCALPATAWSQREQDDDVPRGWTELEVAPPAYPDPATLIEFEGGG